MSEKVIFLATCDPQGHEMEKRVELHKKSRPKTWDTIEEPLNPAAALDKLKQFKGIVIIDCLTLLVSNLMFAGNSEKTIIKDIEKLMQKLKTACFSSIIVSNEVGSSIVPENKLARDFRDVAGKVNQLCAQKSNEVYALISGIPLTLKGK